ncbi:MAG: lysophospholipid acyltransferase family protein [Bacteroidales bacterium]
MVSFITYVLFRLFVALFYILPFRVIYIISDFFAFILYKIIGYRKKVIVQNLKNSFPDWDDKKINQLLFPIYRNISDLMLETIKGFNMTKKQIKKHITTTNIEVMDQHFINHKGIIGVLGHFGNWEWAALLAGLRLKQDTVALYKPLSNKYLDKYIRKNRARFGISMYSIQETYKSFEENKHKKILFAMVADQSPSNINKSVWTTFLNQPTACLHGPEKYACLYQMPVVYIQIIRNKRGYYSITFKTLFEEPQKEESGNITKTFMKVLENDIIQRPDHWLWSHKRWKHKKI